MPATIRGQRADHRRTIALAVALALVPYALLVQRFAFVCDDAYISFRYARHLVDGYGLVYNRGELPPVEGYSNFLWTLWVAFGMRLGCAPELFANATSIACGVVLIVLVTRLAVRRLELGTAAASATALFSATLPPVVLWSTGGLESLAFALACFAVFERLQLDPARPRGIAAGLCAVAAALLRADGAAWALVALCAGAAGRRESRRALFVASALLCAGVGAHEVWRIGYHGDWISNTAHVKAGLSWLRIERGLLYAASFLASVPSVALVLGAALLARGGPERALAVRSAAVVAAAFAYSIFVGGDFLPMGRFLLVAMPFCALLFAGTLAAAAERRGIALAFAALALGASWLASFERDVVPRALRERLHFRWSNPISHGEVEQWRRMRDCAEEWTHVGRALALVARSDESIVLAGIGAVGYFSDLAVHDRYGLVDREVARGTAPLIHASPGHDKGVPIEFFLEREPDYLDAWLAPVGAPPGAGLWAGWRDSALGKHAEVERATLPSNAGFPPDTELRVLRYRPAR